MTALILYKQLLKPKHLVPARAGVPFKLNPLLPTEPGDSLTPLSMLRNPVISKPPPFLFWRAW